MQMSATVESATSVRPGSAPYALLRQRLAQSRGEREEQLRALTYAGYDGALDMVADVCRSSVRLTLSEIDAALCRMDDGTYGACLGCGDAIPVERLEAVPQADCCVRCARLLARDR
jgi:hypothetical protein